MIVRDRRWVSRGAVALLALALSPVAILPFGEGGVSDSGAEAGEACLFGPTRYVRTTGPPDVYIVTVAVPSWVGAPYRLHVQNGEPDGSRRLSSATIEVNGTAVVVPSDFDQQVEAIDRSVVLTPQTTLRLTLDSIPQGFLILDLFGVNADHTAPRVAIHAPASGSATNDATPEIRIEYSDPAGPGEPGASGVEPASLRVHLQREGEAEREITSQLSIAPTGASGSIPAGSELADGGYRLRVTLADAAGNAAESAAAFGVDTVAPTVQITSPSPDSFVRGPTFEVLGSVTDATPVLVEVNETPVNLVEGRFQAPLAGADGPFEIVATAVDAAGNRGSAVAGITLDSSPPVLAVASPPDGLATNAAVVTVAGDVTDLTPVTVMVESAPAALEGDAFSLEVPLESEGPRGLTVTATDAVGNVTTRVVNVVVDRTAPVLNVVTPEPGAILGGLPLVVRGTVSDATAVRVSVDGAAADLTQSAWEASLATRPEGAQSLVVTAADAAGNETTRTVPIVLDLNPPAVVVTQPTPGSLTRDAALTVVGLATDVSLRSVTVNGIAASLEPGGPSETRFTADVPLADGDNALDIVAADALGRTGEARVTVTRDSQPPVISLQVPAQITRSRGGRAVAAVTDNLAVASVVFRLDGVEAARFGAPPYEADLAVPNGKAPGDDLLLTVEAADSAGNVAVASQTVRVAADGVIIGQVLADETGHPLAGALVRIPGREEHATTDGRGRYSLPALDSQAILLIDTLDASRLPVERSVTVAPEGGTVAVDARLTPLSSPVVVGASGGTVAAGAITLAIPADALDQDTSITLTPLSTQGLPNLLPLGWSPLAAFELRGPAGFGVPIAATVTGVPASVVHLATYRPSVHAWELVSRDLAATDGRVSADLPGTGAHALVVPDEGLAPPAPGEVLPALPVQSLAEDAIAVGEVSPLVLPPDGGRSAARLSIRTATAPPSGTIVSTQVTETFTLTSGAVGSEETRMQDVVFYRAPRPADAALAAEIPVAPVRTFGATELVEARVRVVILSGREGVRGRTGGNQAATVSSGPASLTVAAGSLPEDTAVAVESQAISSFVPASADLSPFAEVVVDLSGRRLALAAGLSVEAIGIGPGETLLVARVLRVDGIPRLTVVGVAELSGGRVVARATADLPGIREEGRYVFYRTTIPIGFVRGLTLSGTSPVPALADGPGLPFVAASGLDGRFVLPVRAGVVVTVSARVPATSLAGSADVTVAAADTADVTIGLAGTVTTATVAPPDGSVAVPPTTPIEIRVGVPLNGAVATTENVRLHRGPVAGGQVVPVRLLLSGSGLTLTVIPLDRLEPATTYTLLATGLADVFGGFVVVPATTFTTKTVTPPQYDTTKIVFSFPDANGIVRVEAPAGALPPGAIVLVLNAGNGIAVSFTAGNDGSLSGEIPASIDDRLLVTIRDPLGNVTSFERSQFVADDGSGRVAVGPGGGTVEGPGGVALRIPEGALEAGVVFQVESFGPDVFPERPDLPGASFGSGLRITAPQKPKLRKEADLVFPKPADAPEGAFYYVYRRLTGPEGKVAFEVIDHAFVEGTGDDAKVATASYPFIGWNDSVDSWDLAAAGQSIGFGLGATTNMYLMWSVDALRPGTALPGLVRGRVLRAKPLVGSEVEYEPVAGAAVTAVDESGQSLILGDTPGVHVARTGEDGTYALWDPNYFGGVVRVTATVDGIKQVVSGFEADPDSTTDQKLLTQYRNVAVANFLYPAREPGPEPPQIEIRVMREVNGMRSPAGGFVQAGEPLVIGVKSNVGTSLKSLTATVQGQPLSLMPDYFGGADRMDYILDFTPTIPDTYNVVVTAVPLSGLPVTVSHAFLAVAAGGDNRRPIAGPPYVVSGLLLPAPGSTGVATTVLPQVVFSEPVRNPVAAVSLLDVSEGESVPIVVSGVALDIDGNPRVVPDLSLEGSNLPMTSLTIRPLGGLKFETRYSLALNRDGIEDFDQPLPQKLAVDATFLVVEFTTLAPILLGESPEFGTASGLVVLGDRAYVAVRTDTSHGVVRVFDTAVPSAIREIPEAAVAQTGQAMTVDGEEDSPVTGGRIVAAGFGLAWLTQGPSNLFVWDASVDRLARVAVVSLTQSTQEGTVLRVEVEGRYAYALTAFAGASRVQVVDLLRAREIHSEQMRVNPAGVSASFTQAGVGFAQEAIVAAIDVRAPGGAAAHLAGLKVGNFVVDGEARRLVVATGSLPLVILDPFGASEPLFAAPGLELAPGGSAPAPGSLTRGAAVVLGQLAGRPIALVAGYGTALPRGSTTPVPGPVLAVVDLTDPRHPRPLGFVLLEGSPRDVVLKDRFAVVAGNPTTAVVNVGEPTRPAVAGTLPGFGSRLAVADPHLVLHVPTDASSGGFRVAQLQPLLCASLFPKVVPPSTIARLSFLDWSMQPEVSDDDGLVLKEVKLGTRLMAHDMKLPYFKFESSTSPAVRCELMKDGLACGAGSKARSRLVNLSTPDRVEPGAQGFALEASYLVDRLFGDPEAPGSQAKEACLLVTQRYEFAKEGLDECEPSGDLSCARFWPTVSYRYFAAPDAPTLLSFNSGQRFSFAPPPLTSDVSTDKGMAALFKDIESPVQFPFGACLIGIAVAKTPYGNPIPEEINLRVVSEGQSTEKADNLHLSPWFEGKDRIDGPRACLIPPKGAIPGCPECVHMHWRWSHLVDDVNENFDIHDALPIIPANSNQDVDIAVVVGGRDYAAEDDPADYSALLDGEKLFTPAGPGASSSAEPLVFWYSATGHHASDKFFLHGGFFSSLKIYFSEPFRVDELGRDVSIKVRNRTGHDLFWTASFLDSTGQVVGTGQLGTIENDPEPTIHVDLPNSSGTFTLRVTVRDKDTRYIISHEQEVVVESPPDP